MVVSHLFSFELQTDTKLYFGGKKNFFKRKYKKTEGLDKDSPMEMRGSKSDSCGNRKAKLKDLMFIFKPVFGIKFEIKLKLSKNEKQLLQIIEQQSNNNENYFNFEINFNDAEKAKWSSFTFFYQIF